MDSGRNHLRFFLAMGFALFSPGAYADVAPDREECVGLLLFANDEAPSAEGRFAEAYGKILDLVREGRNEDEFTRLLESLLTHERYYSHPDLRDLHVKELLSRIDEAQRAERLPNGQTLDRTELKRKIRAEIRKRLLESESILQATGNAVKKRKKIDALLQVRKGHRKFVKNTALSDDGRFALSSSFKGEIFFWDLKKKNPVRVMDTPEGYALEFKLAPRNDRAVIALSNSDNRVWDLKNDLILNRFTGTIDEIGVSKDGKYALAMDKKENRAIYWEIKPWEANLVQPDGSPLDLKELIERGVITATSSTTSYKKAAFTPDGKRILLSSTAGYQLWDVEAKRSLFEEPHSSFSTSAAISLDGKNALFQTLDKKSVLYTSLEDPKKKRRIVLAEVEAGCGDPLLFSPDGARAMTFCGKIGMIVLFDPRTGDILKRFTEPQVPTHTRFSADGKQLIFVPRGETGIVRWDLESESRQNTLLRKPSIEFNLSLNPEGTQMTGGTADGDFLYWDLKLLEQR